MKASGGIPLKAPFTGADTPKLFATIVMPALNEEGYIAEAVQSVTPRSGAIDYEILILDGGSTDQTCRIVEDLARQNPRIKLVQNERRIQSAAVNKAAIVADQRSQILVRADCHADYPAGFVERCINELLRREAVSVVVPMRTVGRTCFQKAVASAQNSCLGNGGAAHRRSGQSRYVEHGHHAAFQRAAFLDVGGYDETFTHNEDAELDIRLRRAGGLIWLSAETSVRYFPRATVRALARQYYNYGRGRACTLLKHRMRPQLRQLLPPTVSLLGILGAILALLDWHFALIPVFYISGALLAGALLAVEHACPCAIASGFAALIMHMSWSVGFVGRLLGAALFGRRTRNQRMTQAADTARAQSR